ncbi:M28 family peptidase [Fulvivirga lutea]|uniref:M20/M25/M40 family metallo-hydrolase n=1 Tax=Fulvivirga lutea TaxID=2810512 RepID=A0A974WEN8_9BACT|nr:M28 family peptidase [Fulvivirga lutea]QSE97004.1 M20/M25/M40 family metallo-hydrolase [Fulvivirga lutea]
MKSKLLLPGVSFVFLIIICVVSFNQITPPEPALPGYTPDSYSAYRAIEHLKIVAKEPHGTGTPAHKRVRNYIYDQCKKLGAKIKVLTNTGIQYRGGTNVTAGTAYNILAKLEGTDNSKAVLVMGHYDSQPNTPGAGDDGSSIASMLEVMELLAKQGPLKNDIYFLMTDQEEVGLLGAEAFVNSYPELDEIGMLLNFDARGNTGVNFTFETTSQNGWIMREFSKAVDQPLANALAYEIYKLMPNGSDFTEFKDTHISGLNSAFIEGHAYYHSPEDTWRNMNLGTLQHQGDLMWEMVNHFGTIDLNETKAEDAIFFSILNQVVIYPASLDWPLIVLSIVLLGFTIYFLRSKQSVNMPAVFKGAGLYLALLIISFSLVWIINSIILSLNPHFSSFYGNDFYNSGYYIWCFIGACTVVLGVILKYLVKSSSGYNFLLGSLIIQAILILVLKIYVPTGAFILYVPMIINLVLMIIASIKQPIENSIAPFLIIVIPVLLWLPFIYFLFVVFSFSLPYASAIFVLLLLPYLAPLMQYWNNINNHIVYGLGALMIAYGLLAGQLTASPSDDYPQQTTLAYGLNLDTNEAIWFSRQKLKDEFISNYIKSDEQGHIEEIYSNSSAWYWKDEAPVVNIMAGRFAIVSDTIVNDMRELTLKIMPGHEVTYFNISLPEDAYFTQINERELEGEMAGTLQYYGAPSSGCILKIKAKPGTMTIPLVESKMSIANALLTTPLPEDFIWAPGYMSNNMFIKRTIDL